MARCNSGLTFNIPSMPQGGRELPVPGCRPSEEGGAAGRALGELSMAGTGAGRDLLGIHLKAG